MKPSDIEILLHEGEGSMLEYKENLSTSFARELVAFANTLGGRILLGVRDDGTVVGIPDSNVLRARIQDIARNCDPPVHVVVEAVGQVIVVHVRESDSKPVQCSEGFFRRQGATTQKLKRDEVRDVFHREGAIRFDLAPCSEFRYPQDFDREKYTSWLRLSGITGRPRTEDVLVNIEAAERAGGSSFATPASCFSRRTSGTFSTRRTLRASWPEAQTKSTSWTARTSMAASWPTSRMPGGLSRATRAPPGASRLCDGRISPSTR